MGIGGGLSLLVVKGPLELIRYLWCGDIPLVKTYWLFGVVAGIMFNIAFTYIEYQGEIFTSGFADFFVLGLILFYFIYSGFICVAIWRSANKYQGLQRYAVLAKFAVILGVIALIKATMEMFGVT